MPGNKKGRGRGNGSLKKDTDSNTTRSKAKKQKQQELSDSLASLSSLINHCNPKKLSPVREGRKLLPIHHNTSPQKQAAVDSPEHKHENIAPVVIETKRKNKTKQVRVCRTSTNQV